MREQDFIKAHKPQWQALEQFFATAENARSKTQWAEFPSRYRMLCEQLALAQAQGFSDTLIAQLNTLAIAGNRLLYQKKQSFATSLADFLFYQLPQSARREWQMIALSAGIFLATIIIGLAVAFLFPDYSAAKLASLLRMYEPSTHARIGETRFADSDVMMWGHYIYHNTSISLKTLAGGALAGVPTAFVLGANGVHFGMASGVIISSGWFLQTYLPFIITHAAFELTALVFASAIGFSLARAIIFPQQLTRSASAQRCLRRLFPLLVAVIAFDFIAAAIEAFWSARVLPVGVKFASGALMWALVGFYFYKVGRYGTTSDH